MSHGRHIDRAARDPAANGPGWLAFPPRPVLLAGVVDNPYQASSYNTPTLPPSGAITPEMLQALARTKPCVRFCSVTGFIFSAVSMLFGGLMMVGGTFNAMSGKGGMTGSTVPIVMGIFSITFSLLYLFPAIKLWKYGTAILQLLATGSAAELGNALEQQRGFWKQAAIMLVLGIAFMILALALSLFSSFVARR